MVELSDKQKALFPEWVERFVRLGLSTELADKRTAEEGVRELYRLAGAQPVTVIWVGSPVAGALAASIGSSAVYRYGKKKPDPLPPDDSIHRTVEGVIRGAAGQAVQNSMDDVLRSVVYNAVYGAVCERVDVAVETHIQQAVYGRAGDEERGQVYRAFQGGTENTVRFEVYDAVYRAIDNAVPGLDYNSVRSLVDETICQAVSSGRLQAHAWYSGQFTVSYTAWTTYLRDVLKMELPVSGIEKLSISSGCAWMNRHFCMVCDRPAFITRDERGKLHNDRGMAIRWRDGWGLYLLHGVRMKPEQVLTPAAEISPEAVLGERDIEVRRELLHKVGVDRMSGYGEVIEDTRNNLKGKLINMGRLFRRRYAPHLLVEDASQPGVFHLEAVSPDCKTVQQAHNWRAGNVKINWQPYQLS